MKLKYKNGKLVQERFDGDHGQTLGSVANVRLDALSPLENKQNLKLKLEQDLKNKIYQQKLETQRKVKLLEMNKKMLLQKQYADLIKKQQAIAVKQAQSEFKTAKEIANKWYQKKLTGSESSTLSLVGRPMAGFGEEGVVLDKPRLADFNSLNIENDYERSNTNVQGFEKYEQQQQAKMRVEKKLSGKTIGEHSFTMRNQFSHPLLMNNQSSTMGGFCCDISLSLPQLPKLELPKINLPQITLPKIELPKIQLPNLSLPNLSLPKINIPGVSLPNLNLSVPTISQLGKSLGDLANSDLNPILMMDRSMKSIPGVSSVYKELDKFTGGTFTSMTNLASMPGRAMKGEAISQADFVDAASFALKAGLIIGTGGSAAALIGGISSQLKKGPLGETELGRTLLGAGEIAGLAYASGELITDVASKKAVDIAKEKATEEAAKKTGAVGTILVAATTSKISNPEQSFVAVSMQAAGDEAKKQSVLEIQKKTGIPATLATGMVEGKVPTQDSVQAAIVADVKNKAANEFEKKTGMPVTIAAQIAQGKAPTMKEIKEKAYTGLTKSPEMLKAELANIDSKIESAPRLAQAVMLEKKKAITETLQNRDQIKQKVEAEGAARIDQARAKVKATGEEADKIRLQMNELKNKSLELRQKSLSITDLDLKNKLLDQAELIEKQLLSLMSKLMSAEANAKNAIREADETVKTEGFNSTASEYGAYDPKKKSMGLGTMAMIGVGAVAALGVGVAMAQGEA